MSELFEKHERPAPKWLKPEEVEIWKELNAILESDNVSPVLISHERLDEIMERKSTFTEELKSSKDKESNNIIPQNYLLWHRVMGSTPSDNVRIFDTENHDIEKFIRSLVI